MTVCLNMIVRNEEHCIRECLESVKDKIDYYVICDTGSSDNTIDIIREVLGPHGEIHKHEWKNFGHNRTEALKLADSSGCDYAFIMDADDIFNGNIPVLTGDVVEVPSITEGGFEYTRRNFVKLNAGFRWYGPVHEFVHRDSAYSVQQVISAVCHITARSIGARNKDGKAAKYKRDIEMLKEAYANEKLPRYAFYIAQSYFGLEDWRNAIKWYQRRARQGGYAEEVAVSMRKAALAKELAGHSVNDVKLAMLDAWECRPNRVEPLYDLARLCRTADQHWQAHLFARQAAAMQQSSDRLFVESYIYDWAALEEVGLSAYNIGNYKMAAATFYKLINDNKVPEEHLPRILRNFDEAQLKLESD